MEKNQQKCFQRNFTKIWSDNEREYADRGL